VFDRVAELLFGVVLEARCAVCTAAVGFGCGYSCSLLL